MCGPLAPHLGVITEACSDFYFILFLFKFLFY